MAFLTRIDPTRNVNRFYVVQVMPSLFGDWTVMREWGLRGSPGTVRLSSYERRNEAETVDSGRSSAGCSEVTRPSEHARRSAFPVNQFGH